MPYDRAERPHPSTHSSADDGDPSGPSNSNTTSASVAGTYFLGRYRVVDEIGVGGMASVHLARMDGPGGFQKWVAIKRIHPHLVEDDTFVHMFLDEARIAARISHPNVASVFELGKHEDTYWIAMEYLHGEPLREVMRRTEETGQPMPPEIACRVIADAAEGLHAAHELVGKNGEKLQLVHRDVTPHNLFVTYDGTTKVVDFGIAKFSSRMASTRAGTLKGKLAYMSPEQVAGEQIDRRTDLFALGVVLWELTTGQRLFRMESDIDTLAKVQECNVPRPTSVVRGYPLDLEKIVMKALAKNKNERYKTAREFSRALQSLLMRRGLFIASDEVAGYVQAIFQDRIRKREEHLRWAAEVTQTINIDSKLEAARDAGLTGWGNEPSLVTFNSEVQSSPQTARGVPRPAAGMPASAPRASQTPPPLPHASQHSVPTSPEAGSRGPGARRPGALPDTVRPPPKAGPVAALNVTQQTAAAVPKQKQASALPSRAPHPAADEPPTIRASPRAREQMLEMAVAAATMPRSGRSSQAPPQRDPQPPQPAQQAPQSHPADLNDYDDFDDTDDTIVTSTRPVFPPPEDRPSAPLPAAGRPAASVSARPSAHLPAPPSAAFAAPPRPLPPRVPTIPPLPAVVVPPAMFEVGSDALIDQTRSDVSDARPAPGGSIPYGAGAWNPPIIQRGSMSGELPNPLAGARSHAAVDVQRMFAPPSRSDQRTITAALARRRTPLWAVAAASAALALVTFTLIVLVVARFASSPSPAAKPSVAPAPSVGAPDNKIGPSPFAGARTEFTKSIASSAPPAPAPTSEIAPPPAGENGGGLSPATIAAAEIDSAQPTSALPNSTSSAKPAPSAAAGTTGFLTVICAPACASVQDNGNGIGPSPIVRRSVGVGPQRVTLMWGPGKKKDLSTIVIVDKEAKVYAKWP